ncbi:hypothetical protein OU5_4989 [Pseudomonas mandelii JR-1]|uniref:Uncharacterized protein n=1 Tax=Pseudomonas mandelii JR-1 TaxID=1147786 RepID=A0A024EI83_9PSED|nr:hypothetical protein OU5_4989 [Pseudomonas mandelii JR-1]
MVETEQLAISVMWFSGGPRYRSSRASLAPTGVWCAFSGAFQAYHGNL